MIKLVLYMKTKLYLKFQKKCYTYKKFRYQIVSRIFQPVHFFAAGLNVTMEGKGLQVGQHKLGHRGRSVQNKFLGIILSEKLIIEKPRMSLPKLEEIRVDAGVVTFHIADSETIVRELNPKVEQGEMKCERERLWGTAVKLLDTID